MGDLSESIGKMTLGELEAMIRHLIQEEIGVHPWYQLSGDQPVEDVINAMWNDLWTPPEGAKSSLEMLREDRG